MATLDQERAQRLAKAMKGIDISQRQLGIAAHVSYQQIGFILSGKRKTTYEFMCKVAPTLKVSPDYLWKGKDPIQELKEAAGAVIKDVDQRDSFSFPILDYISAGQLFTTEEKVEGVLKATRSELDMSIVHPERTYAVRVVGTSLEGDEIYDGDVLLVEKEPIFVDGDIYIVRVGAESAVRHVYRDNGMARLVSSNGECREIKVTELDIRGRVLYSRPPMRKHFR
jgi:SOS-response transcriptional repressor LexA